MAILNFPNTGLYDGYQWTGDNGTTYIYDGIKWVGHAVAQPAGTSSITNNGFTLQINGEGNLVIPTGAHIYYQDGTPLPDAQGPQGVKGDTGTDATVDVGTVTTGIAGSSAIVSNIGTPSAAVFEFTIPRGDKGDRGTTGQNGLNGLAGTNGANGTNGVGQPGSKGDKGDTGAQGVSVTLQGTKATITDLPAAPVNPNDFAGHGWIVTTGDVGAGHADGALWFWNLALAQWDDIGVIVGPKGDKGDTGDRGLKGDTGTNGTNGLPGDNGQNGLDGQGVPGGGSAGQILSKIDSDDFNTEWVSLAVDRITANGISVVVNGNGTLVLPATDTDLINTAIIGSTANIQVDSNGSAWTFDTDGNLTLPTGGDIFGLYHIGNEGNHVVVDPTASSVTLNTYDMLRQSSKTLEFNIDGVLSGGENNRVQVTGIQAKRGNDLNLVSGHTELNTRLIKFLDADGSSKNTYLVNGLDYQLDDILYQNGNAYIWYALGSNTNINNIVDNLDTTWTVTFDSAIALAADTEYTVEWSGKYYNRVRIQTENATWNFEPYGAIQFDGGENSRQWTPPSVLSQPLPYALDINTNTRRVVGYNVPQAEIDIGVMTLEHTGSEDDTFHELTSLPFNITFLNNTYTRISVGSNSYISFGGTTNHYAFGDDASMRGANLPAILISEADNSFQRVYSHTTGTSGSQEYTIRYEGTAQTGGTVGQPNIVWQITFYEADPNLITLLLIQDARGMSGISGITDGYNWQLQRESGGKLPRLPWNCLAPRAIQFNNSTVDINTLTDNVTIGVGLDGTALPTLSTGGPNSFDLFTAPTLVLGANDSPTNITQPEYTDTNRGGQPIRIQGQRGYGDYSNTGDGGWGGNIEIFGGRGGETSNEDTSLGGEGGYISIKGGSGQNGENGGYAELRAGNAEYSSNVGREAYGGHVYINAGNANSSIATGKGHGGNVNINAGTGNKDGQHGDVVINTNNGYWRFGQNGVLWINGGYALTSAQNTTINAGSAPTVAYTSLDGSIGSIKATIKVVVQQADVGGDFDIDTQVCEMLIAVKRRFIDNGGTWVNTAVGTVYGVTHTSTAPLATFTVNFVQGYIAGPGIQPRDVVQILAEPTAAVTGINMWVMVAATEMTND